MDKPDVTTPPGGVYGYILLSFLLLKIITEHKQERQYCHQQDQLENYSFLEKWINIIRPLASACLFNNIGINADFSIDDDNLFEKSSNIVRTP